jgi:hypothetical protein
MRDMRIDYSKRWQHQHWEAIRSAYRSTPYFDYVADRIAPFYEREWRFLVDYNSEILATELKPLLEELNIECLLFGGQISRSFAHFEPALKPLLNEVSSLKHISPMQNLSTAAPLGILSMLRKSLNL